MITFRSSEVLFFLVKKSWEVGGGLVERKKGGKLMLAVKIAIKVDEIAEIVDTHISPYTLT